MKGREGVIAALYAHRPWDAHEDSMRMDVLRLVESHEDCFLRTCMPGHLTASAWVVAQRESSVLMLHHAKLGKWLQPGGHADGMEDLEVVARKELAEEAGLDLDGIGASFFDVDVHLIPARGGVPAHAHHDIRFLFFVPEALPLTINHESLNAKWIPLDEVGSLNPDASVMRMVAKTMAM